MLFYETPKTDYDSMIDIGKFNMIWNVAFILVPIFSVLLIFHLVNGDGTWLSSVIALSSAFISLFILKKTRKHEVVAIFIVIIGVVVCQMAIHLLPDSQLISNVLWCVLVGIFSFFVLNSFWGVLVLMINLTSLLAYFSSNGNNVFIAREVDLKMTIDVLYVGLALGFVIHKMIVNINNTNSRYELENARSELLLKEIHHRVKNNLQIISSLLKLQSYETESVEVKKHFNEAIGRIRSMALIHEKMYSNDDLANVNLKSYLTNLSSDICESMNASGDLKLNIDSELDKVDIKSMVPISLIFNELITNSLKHGIKDVNNGEITIKVHYDSKSTKFYYSDNGIWIPPIKEGTFGLELLETLASQLDGTVTRSTENGTNYQFMFKTEALFY